MKPTDITKLDLIEEIKATIGSIPNDLPPGAGSDTAWTAFLKSKIREIGKKHGYLVSPCPDDGNKEWLYDLIWFRNDSANQLSEVALVLESEWSSDSWHIQEDFEKLLVAKAPIKVMVFQSNGNNLQGLWDQLTKSIDAFKQRSQDETYILAAFNGGEHKFEFKDVPGA